MPHKDPEVRRQYFINWRRRNQVDPETQEVVEPRPCRCGCGKIALCGGYLRNHRKRSSPVDYVAEDRGFTTPCWIWKLAINNHGYGVTAYPGGKVVLAHILYYEKKHGLVPEGLELDHLCRVPACMNPDHLEAVTHVVNIQRGKTAKLNLTQVLEIRKEYNAPGDKWGRQSSLAHKYGVTAPTIRCLVLGMTWKGVVAISEAF